MAELITIYWRDIPAQVIGRSGRTKVKRVLPPRFADAIDTAAMRAGRGNSDAYLAEWRRDARPCEGNLDDAVEREVERLVNSFDDDELRRIARNDGRRQEDPA
jgi:hypothetical protein